VARCIIVVALAIAGLSSLTVQTSANALSGSSFSPGYIISDQLFYNSATMGAPQIQQFLNGKYNGCNAGYTCIRDYSVATINESAEANLCNGYTAAASETAAQIIAKVAVSCGINPQVLLVLLQKESGMLTSKSPSYTQVTGFNCPDSTGCDPAYFGFQNQVYLAARQFKKYRLNPTNYGYVAGRNNNILFHPNAACSSSSVYIVNQATAGLYDYTPYQPNAAALNNLNGTGDGCSSYGNRNFWVYFNTWFGPPAFVAPTAGTYLSCLGSSIGSSPALLAGSTQSAPVGQVSTDRMSDLLALDGAGGLWMYRNGGTAAAAAPFVTRTPAAAPLPAYVTIAAGDVNGDGRADVIAAGPDGSLWLYLGSGTSDPYAAGPVRIAPSGWQIYDWIGLADVNGDGRADILATTGSGQLIYFQNNGSATPFQNSLLLSTGWQNYSVMATGDVNGDGHADLVATSSSGALSLLLNNGAATGNPFTGSASVIGASGWNNFDRIALADINGDGYADLVTTSPDGRLWNYLNSKTATPFSATAFAIIGPAGWSNYPTIILADVHGSSAGTDLVATRPDGSLWYYQNNGSAVPFVGTANVGGGGWNNFQHIALGDVNSDGRRDLVASSADGRLWYYANTNTCQPFSRSSIIGSGGWQNFNNIELGDVNADGLDDLIATSPGGQLWYYQNNGSAIPFTTPVVIGASGWQNFTHVIVGDVNGDGKADLIATSGDGRLWYYQNNGSATPFVTPAIIGAGGWQNFNHITTGDVNGDGKADLIATSGDGRLWYYQNNGSASPFTSAAVIGGGGWQVYNRVY
jgi:hypothetical protein